MGLANVYDFESMGRYYLTAYSPIFIGIHYHKLVLDFGVDLVLSGIERFTPIPVVKCGAAF